MTVNEFITTKTKSIQLNFAMRNEAVCSPKRMEMIKSHRRSCIRKMITQLRVARNPKTQSTFATYIAFVTN